MSVKDELHGRIDELSDLEAAGMLRLIDQRHGAVDPMLEAVALAPEDDEPLSEDDLRAVEEARAELRRGEGVPFESIRHEFE